MALQFIMGGSGAGKTRFLYERLIEESERRPGQQFVLIVPEQFTMQTQKEIVSLHPRRGTMNIDIVSFERLAYRVFEELAVVNPAVLDDMGKSMILRKVAAIRGRDLGIFRGHLGKVGFIGQLKSMVSELYQYGISLEQLREMETCASSQLLKAKLRDLGVLYEGFQEYIREKFITAEELLGELCRVFPRSERMRGSTVVLDGYTGFTPVQYRLLEQMLVCCRDVKVAVTVERSAKPYERSGVQNLFYMSKETVCRLSALAAANHVPQERDCWLERRPYPRFKSGELDFLEQKLYRYSRASSSGQPESIFLYRALNPREEIQFVAGRIESLVREQGLRYREIAVVTGDLERYGKEAAFQFEEKGIPCFLDVKKSILENPLVEFIRAALEAVRSDCSYEGMFRYLKCGLAVEPEQREMCDRAENYCLALGIRGWKRWETPWELVYRGGRNLNLEELNAFREMVTAPLARLREGLREKDRTMRSMTEALVNFLTEMEAERKILSWSEHFREQGEYQLADEYSQVYGLVMEMFDRLAALLGDEKAGIREFGEILDAGFGEIQVGVIPATVDRVVVGDITRTRLNHIRALFFVGVNDGVVPVRRENGGILSETDREFLEANRMELAPTARKEGFLQRFYLYLALSRPEEYLILSFASMDGAGKSLRPSSLVREVEKLFPDLACRDAAQERRIMSPQEGKHAIAGMLREGRTGETDDRSRELYRYFWNRETDREWLKKLVEAACYSYEARGIGRAAARELYGRILSGSVTRMEQYEACAYAHFLSYGLELQERQEYELRAADMGNLYHAAIDGAFRRAADRGRRLQDMDDAERNALSDEAVEEAVADYGGKIMTSSARNLYLAGKVGRITRRTLWALAEQLRRGEFDPVGFEMSFSAADNLSALKIRLSEDEALHLRGRIDRMDLCEDEKHIYVKIIDYKSGGVSFDLAALYYGLQLQLVVYMDAAMELMERRNPEKEVVPAGVFYYHIDDPVVDGEEADTREEADRAALKKLRMDGLVNSEPGVISLMDREIETASDVIPVAMKNGLIQEPRSSVANRARFSALRKYVRGKLRQAGLEILDGRTEASPYKQGKRTACDYCPYHGVCGFDRNLPGYDFNRLRDIKAEDIWNEIEGDGGEEEI